MVSLEQIWQNYQQRLLAFITKQLGDPVAAQDISQEVFTRTLQKLPQLRDAEKLESWLFQIARNAITDHYRQRREQPLPANLIDQPLKDEPELHRELEHCLAPIVQQLPDEYRDAVLLSDLQGLSQQQLADHLGMTLSGAKSRVQRGRVQLRRLLEQCCHFELDHQGQIMDYCPRHKNNPC